MREILDSRFNKQQQKIHEKNLALKGRKEKKWIKRKVVFRNFFFFFKIEGMEVWLYSGKK